MLHTSCVYIKRLEIRSASSPINKMTVLNHEHRSCWVGMARMESVTGVISIAAKRCQKWRAQCGGFSVRRFRHGESTGASFQSYEDFSGQSGPNQIDAMCNSTAAPCTDSTVTKKHMPGREFMLEIYTHRMNFKEDWSMRTVFSVV